MASRTEPFPQIGIVRQLDDRCRQRIRILGRNLQTGSLMCQDLTRLTRRRGK